MKFLPFPDYYTIVIKAESERESSLIVQPPLMSLNLSGREIKDLFGELKALGWGEHGKTSEGD